MKSNLIKVCALVLVSSSILLSGCSKSDGAAQGGSPTSATPPKADSSLPKANANTPLDQYVKLTSGNQLMFIYYSLSNRPVDYEKIADQFSREYLTENDTFKKKDLLVTLKPSIDAEIAKAKNLRYIVLEEGPMISSYDFATKSFAIGNEIGAGGSGGYSDNSTHFAYTNGDDFKSLKVTDEAQARKIEALVTAQKGSIQSQLNGGVNTNMKLVFYAYVQDADPTDTTVKLQIVKLQLVDAQGKELFTQ